MVTITDEELLEKARVLFAKLGGVKSQDARLVRALIERAGLSSQPTKRAVDDATRRDFEKAHDHTYGYNSLCGLCNPHRN